MLLSIIIIIISTEENHLLPLEITFILVPNTDQASGEECASLNCSVIVGKLRCFSEPWFSWQ